ncbi:sigma-70 family RNA polymerase sigma factor [Actinoplanes sp. TFC3]|uniref:sigma-70 family RNA polymerase sigma factor n=1 Tax=Actinoplanes sp. TFC3 TaxID=1710355 RepID=UPI0008334F0D|nr:sigma-70 family RNA polymerase sigma factor [Actinoplanes sp. TFC3]
MASPYGASSRGGTPSRDADSDLLAAVRAGDTAAYGVLYERHLGAARAFAYRLVSDPADVDDLVAETFAKVFAALRAGRGPLVAFRAYLTTTLRHVCYHRARRDRRLEFTDDLTRYDEGQPFLDPALDRLERTYAARAFRALPDRWRDVLWRTEVEGASPAEVAPQLGLTPNAVAVLAHRAREGLRRLYLQQHVAVADPPECRWAGERLGGRVRGRLAQRDSVRLENHLRWCAECRARLAEITEVHQGHYRPYRQRNHARPLD